MGYGLRSPSTDVSFSLVESVTSHKISKMVGVRAFARVGDFNNKERYGEVVSKASISGHSIPGQLEWSFTGKKQITETLKKLEFVRTLLIDNYDSYTYNIYQELSVINGLPPVVIHNDEWSWEEFCHYVYEEKAFDNIVVSPGPGSPACAADIGICLRVLLECRDIPILGVCLGHQALGYVHGAQVVHAPEPVHGRLSDIEHNDCGLFHGIPCGPNSGFKVVRYHSLVIDPSSLPRELVPIAWTSPLTSPFIGSQDFDAYLDDMERHTSSSSLADSIMRKQVNGRGSSCSQAVQKRKVLMGIMHSKWPHYGLQFHPESIATHHGREIFKNFAKITKDYWLRLRASQSNNGKIQYAGNRL